MASKKRSTRKPDELSPLKIQHANGFTAGKFAMREDLRAVIIEHFGSIEKAEHNYLGLKLLQLLKD